MIRYAALTLVVGLALIVTGVGLLVNTAAALVVGGVALVAIAVSEAWPEGVRRTRPK
jgi:hypothetical protein